MQFPSLLRIFSSKQSSQDGYSFIVVSLQVQPVVSLAHKLGLAIEETGEKLSAFFKSMGADLVLDLQLFEDVAVIEQRREFVSKVRDGVKMPLMTSACPGWVCYAEKTHGNLILPHISTVKSAQQIMGSFVKDSIAKKRGLNPERIFHITLMPCFDKKLEASRPDFSTEAGVKDVDMVITSIEIDQMLTEQQTDLKTFDRIKLDSPFEADECWNAFHEVSPGSASGGYTENVFVHAVKELFGEEVRDLEYAIVKNSDFQEVTFSQDGEVRLRFAVANGFRNIQNVVQKMKRKRCQYHFVEIMACPSGCLNGGAQCRPESGNAKELITSLEEEFKALRKRDPELNPHLKRLYSEWLGGREIDKASQMLFTQDHEVEKITSSLAIKW